MNGTVLGINNRLKIICDCPFFHDTKLVSSFSDEINLIKSVMRNIQLPSSAIPEWAKKIPEDKWKQPLVSALEQRTDRNNENVDTKSNTQSPSKTM